MQYLTRHLAERFRRAHGLVGEAAVLAERFARFTLLSVATWTGHAVAYACLGRPAIATANGCAAALSALVFLAVFAHPSVAWLRRGVHALIAVTLLTLAFAARDSGGGPAMASWYLVLIPIGAGFAIGRRAALGWGGITVLTMAAIHTADVLAPTAPEFVPDNAELFVAQSTLAVVAFALAFVSRRATDAQLAIVEEQAGELARARDEALAASRAKSAFLATMSHELRTPLHGVIATASLLEREDGLEAHSESVQTIRASADALLAIVNDVLDFSKIEANKVELTPRPVAFAAFLTDVLRVIQHAAQRKQLALASKVDEGVPATPVFDADKVRQILLNLLNNAVKFTKEGSVSLHVSASSDCIVMRVKDTGIGLTQTQQSKLFDAFTQVEASTTRAHGGTGLGLAISRRLARIMGGDIDVESELGVGSTFTVRLPMVMREPVESQGETEPTEPRKPFPTLRILLVDDEPINRRVAERMLSRIGLAVDLAVDGTEGLQAALTGHYDVVFLDRSMPGMDGVEVARAIRSTLPQDAQPWIVAMTANVSAEDQALYREAGMNDFVGKPIALPHLERALARVPLRPARALD